MTLAAGYNGDLSFAVANIIGTSNEDKSFYCLSHKARKNPSTHTQYSEIAEIDGDISSFGVFDGHNGSLTSETCSRELHDNVVATYRYLLHTHQRAVSQATSAHKSLPHHERLTAKDIEFGLFCDAINTEIDALHKRIIKHDNSGSTLVSLFLLSRPTDSEIRAIVANIGDSRCICITAQSVQNMTNFFGDGGDHIGRDDDLDFSTHSGRSDGGLNTSVHSDNGRGAKGKGKKKGGAEVDMLSASTHNMGAGGATPASFRRGAGASKAAGGGPSGDLSSHVHFSSSADDLGAMRSTYDNSHIQLRSQMAGPNEAFIHCVSMSEDHNLSCHREMFRIMTKRSLSSMALPWDVAIQGIKVQTHRNGDYYMRKLMERGLSSIRSPASTNELDTDPEADRDTPESTPRRNIAGQHLEANPPAGDALQPPSIDLSLRPATDEEILQRVCLTVPSSFKPIFANNNHSHANDSNGHVTEPAPNSVVIVPSHSEGPGGVVTPRPVGSGDSPRSTEQDTVAAAVEPDRQLILDQHSKLISSIFQNTQGDLMEEHVLRSYHVRQYLHVLREMIKEQKRAALEAVYGSGGAGGKARKGKTRSSPSSSDSGEDDEESCSGESGSDDSSSTGDEHESSIKRAGKNAPVQDIQSNKFVGAVNKVEDRILPTREESYIANRFAPGGARGPLAYFGRYSNSLLMTRSIGDRFGPRGCLHTPDITLLNIPRNTHARFVLASDGMWDVIDNNTVRRMGMFYKYNSSGAFAIALAHKAHRRRIKRRMRPDDITVLVVDVYFQNAQYIKTRYSKYATAYPLLPSKATQVAKGGFGDFNGKEGEVKISKLPEEQQGGCVVN